MAAISDTRVLRWRTQAYNTRRRLHVSRRYTHPLRPVDLYTRFASALCPFIRWLVVQEICIYIVVLNLPAILNQIWPASSRSQTQFRNAAMHRSGIGSGNDNRASSGSPRFIT